MDIYAPKYGEVNKVDAFRLMDLLRSKIVLPCEAEKGRRFNDNVHTLWVLESQTTKTQFIEDPIFHVTAALVESAKSDYHYNYEKVWDDSDDYFVDYDDCEDSGMEK